MYIIIIICGKSYLTPVSMMYGSLRTVIVNHMNSIDYAEFVRSDHVDIYQPYFFHDASPTV